MLVRPGCACCGYDAVFNQRVARRELRRYQRKGPRRTTKVLVDVIARDGVHGASLTDVGGGVGMVQHELHARGVARVTDVDASSAYLEAARGEAERRGYAQSATYVLGDFAEAAARLPTTDLVTLDRVVCCYRHMQELVGAAAVRARKRLGLVVPRDGWWVRWATRLANAGLWVIRNPFRIYAHRTHDMHVVIRKNGFHRIHHERGWFWQVDVYERSAA